LQGDNFVTPPVIIKKEKDVFPILEILKFIKLCDYFYIDLFIEFAQKNS